jgi:tripartite-type tricarboxylate transporter receptor subunit TctC
MDGCSMNIRIRALWIAAAVALLFLNAAAARAQGGYPERPIRLITTNPPGGTVDILARIVAEGLRTRLKQPVVVEPKPGANGNVAADNVLRSAPDGYTLLLCPAGPLTTNSLLFTSTRYKPQDFAPVALVANAPLVLVVNPKLPITSVPELIAYAKQHPRRLSFSSQGVGATGHLAMEMLKAKAGIDLVHITYPGSAQAMIDLVTGRVDLAFDNTSTSVPHVRSGELRAIAVAEPKRLPALPDVLTVEEQGVRDFVASPFFAVAAPGATPAEVLDILNRAIVDTMSDPDTRKRLQELGIEVGAGNRAEFAAYLEREITRWQSVVTAAGIAKQ